ARRGALVHAATSARRLAPPNPYRLLCTEEDTGHVCLDHAAPRGELQIFQRHRRGTDARIVEEKVEPPESSIDLGEKIGDRSRIAYVTGQANSAAPCLCGRGAKGFQA